VPNNNGIRYVALRRMKVGDVTYSHGDLLPEDADFGGKQHRMITTGFITAVAGGNLPSNPEPSTPEPAAKTADDTNTGDTNTGYDPSDHTVEEVLAYVKDNPDEGQAVLDAEEKGDNPRKGVVEGIESLLPFNPDRHTFEEIKNHVEDNPDEAQEILNKEKAGQNRKTVVGALTTLVEHQD
jgi:hypothetical protein